MGEARQKTLSEIEARAALLKAAQRRSRIRDRFDRPLLVGDAVMLSQATPQDTVWRIVDVRPSANPRMPGTLATISAQVEVLFEPGAPSPYVVLLVPAAEQPAEKPDGEEPAGGETTAPGPARSPGGIILSDPDRMSER